MKKEKKGFFAEFKKFISRGNVMDLAVGMIIGSAFTAIVTALSNGILKPVINFVIAKIAGGDALDSALTFLKKAYSVDENGVQTIDLAKSIYIDWGAFISAIINFLLIALVLFMIVKSLNKFKDANNNLKDIDKKIAFKKEKGLKLTKKEQAYVDEQDAIAKEKLAEEEKNKQDALLKQESDKEKATNETTNALLVEIINLLNK